MSEQAGITAKMQYELRKAAAQRRAAIVDRARELARIARVQRNADREGVIN